MDKAQLRRTLLNRLYALPSEARSERSRRACQNLVSTEPFQKASTVMMFVSLPHEVDTSEAILHAFLDPTTHMLLNFPSFMKLAGRLITEPDQRLRMILLEQFETVVHRFLAALARALPRVPKERLALNFLFMVGSMVFTWTNCGDLARVTGGKGDLDVYAVIDHMVAFAAAGMRADVFATEAVS